MADKLFEYMDWPRIEGVVYGEENLPREILGPHPVKKGILIQCFLPQAKSVKVHLKDKDRNYKMTKEDEAGFFAVLIPGKTIPDYQYIIENQDKTQEICEDPYRFGSMLSPKDEKLFNEGIDYKLYDKLGAHPMRRNGVKGVYFALWAPNALRVSVIGTFNNWNGKIHPMHKSGASGIYEIFLPMAKPGDLYKFEIMVKGGALITKTDPYAREREREGHASIVPPGRKYSWKDTSWLENRKKYRGLNQPLAIYELNLSKWNRSEEQSYRNYRQLAVEVAEYVAEMGYTHVGLKPVMEYLDDQGDGFDTTGYFAPTSRMGTPDDFQYFIDYLHQKNIGVIMDWTPAHFPDFQEGMHRMDGTCLYEYDNLKKRMHPMWGTYLFNMESPMVRNFLIANGLYWIEVFHLDGIRLDDVDAMLYLDYGREEGEWCPNIYGTNENLEAIEFFKHFNSIVKKNYPDVLLIAQEDGLWPSLTGKVDEEHMGFDYKWNNGWTGDFLDYLRQDPIYRAGCHDELTNSMLYAYCENYILTLNERDIVSVENLIGSIPGDEDQKLSTAKAAYGYLMTHPGKKMMTMEENIPRGLADYMKELLKLYKSAPALYTLDCQPEGFQWIQLLEQEKNIVTFIRMSENMEDTLLVVCNFSGQAYEKHQIGVPYPGKYKEILNSDQVKFQGTGYVNPRVKASRKAECNDREDSITIKMAPFTVSILQYREK